MMNNKLKALMVGGLTLTITTANTFTVKGYIYKRNPLNYEKVSKKSTDNIQLESSMDRYLKFEQQAKIVYEQRLAEEKRLAELEAERIRREEEARLAEINRINSVGVNVDNVLKVSNLTVDELIEIFDYYDYSKPMKELAPIIIEAEKTYGINAFVLSSIISWESSYNTSQRARLDNNVLGWGVYSSNSKGINSNSKYDNIMNACKFLREEYLTEGGIYYNGLSTWGLMQNYCRDEYGNPSDSWRKGINAIAYQYEWIYKDLFVK